MNKHGINIDELELFELVVEDDEDGVYANSLVSAPAIERNFIFFNKDMIQLQSINEEKRLVAGPLLIANKRILRVNEDGEPYAIFFSEKTIEEMARKFMKNRLNNEITIEHGNKKIGGVYLTESWLVEHPLKDKSNSYGFTLPAGTWFGVYKVENDEVWEMVKSGELKGFSVEMLAEHVLSKRKPSTLMSKPIAELTEWESELVLGHILKNLDLKKKIKLESYSDYGQSVRNNARRGRELNEKNGNKCATQVGKVRSAQLEAGEKISLETLKRMYSYLSRAETYYDETDSNACGTISFLLWGGKAGLAWSRNKLRELGETELEVGVPHYTKDGKLWEGPTHKDAEGRLMTGETHSEESEYLYHKEDLAEVGPRGGIKESPKSPKGETPNPNPKGEGTAKGDASGKSAKVTAEQEKTLEGKVKDFNERESNTKNGRATLGQLKSVFQRGLGAFNVSHSPVVKSASQWAYARVNAYLYLLKNGRPESPKYTTDYDLLPKGHPKAGEKMENPSIPNSTYPGETRKKPQYESK